MSIAGVYELPFGQGRRFLSDSHRAVDAILGGWTTSGIFRFNSGDNLQFAQMDVIGDPTIDNFDKWGLMFNADAFKQSEAFVPRTNPKWFPGVLGPGVKNLDLTLSKFFQAGERLRIEFKMEAYNISNSFTPDNHQMNVRSSNFGRMRRQRRGFTGREFQYNMRLHF